MREHAHIHVIGDHTGSSSRPEQPTSTSGSHLPRLGARNTEVPWARYLITFILTKRKLKIYTDLQIIASALHTHKKANIPML